jgi:hypothetical protein
MIQHGIRRADRLDRLDRRSVAPLAPFATIWGLELSVGAFVKYLWIWSAGWKVQLVFAVLAALASIVVWVRMGRSYGRTSDLPVIQPDAIPRALPAFSLPHLSFFALLIAAVAAVLTVLMRLLGGHPMIPAFFVALVLAVGYIVVSRRLGKPLLLLGLWLLALAAVVAVFYPGLAGVVLDFFSGLSLIFTGSMIRLWNRD